MKVGLIGKVAKVGKDILLNLSAKLQENGHKVQVFSKNPDICDVDLLIVIYRKRWGVRRRFRGGEIRL